MFERFTAEARETVVSAQRTAVEWDQHEITSGLLLLAVADDPSSLAGVVLRTAGLDVDQLREELRRSVAPAGGLTEADAEALRSVGIDLPAVLARIEESFGPNALTADANRSRSRRRPRAGRFGNDGKKALELSLREAIRLRHREINTGHLLLGLLRDSGSEAARLLTAAGVSPEAVRTATEAALRQAA